MSLLLQFGFLFFSALILFLGFSRRGCLSDSAFLNRVTRIEFGTFPERRQGPFSVAFLQPNSAGLKKASASFGLICVTLSNAAMFRIRQPFSF